MLYAAQADWRNAPVVRIHFCLSGRGKTLKPEMRPGSIQGVNIKNDLKRERYSTALTQRSPFHTGSSRRMIYRHWLRSAELVHRVSAHAETCNSHETGGSTLMTRADHQPMRTSDPQTAATFEKFIQMSSSPQDRGPWINCHDGQSLSRQWCHR